MSDDSNTENKDETPDWKMKFNELVSTCQTELKKTTQIGMKMVSASQSNAKLHDTYEALGQWLKEAVSNGELEVKNEEVTNLLALATKLELDLQNYEDEVQNIKKG
jgi:hypothetical protein